jgi:hypothetical protein
MRKAVQIIPDAVLAPAVLLLGMLSTHAFDSGYLVYIPLAGVAFANAGRNPVLGLVLAFVGCGMGLAGNLLPGQYDVLIFGITQTGAALLDPSWTMKPIGNWWFILALGITFTALGWLVAVRIVSPRLEAWDGKHGREGAEAPELLDGERKGLRAAGWVALLIVAVTAALLFIPGYTPLYDASAAPAERILPFYRSIVPLIFALLLFCGWAYGKAAHTIHSHRDVATMMAKGLEGMSSYLVMVFFAAHFVAMFGWSNLAPISAINGAAFLRSLDAPPALLLPLLATGSAWLDFLIASGSAKWTAVGSGRGADDDAARHLARDDHRGLPRRRYGHQPDLAAQSLFRARASCTASAGTRRCGSARCSPRRCRSPWCSTWQASSLPRDGWPSTCRSDRGRRWVTRCRRADLSTKDLSRSTGVNCGERMARLCGSIRNHPRLLSARRRESPHEVTPFSRAAARHRGRHDGPGGLQVRRRRHRSHVRAPSSASGPTGWIPRSSRRRLQCLCQRQLAGEQRDPGRPFEHRRALDRRTAARDQPRAADRRLEKSEPEAGTDARRVKAYYDAFLDTATIDKLGMAPIQRDLRRIAAISDKTELADALGATSAPTSTRSTPPTSTPRTCSGCSSPRR